MINASGLLNTINQSGINAGEQKKEATNASDAFLSLLQQLFSGSASGLANSVEDMTFALASSRDEKPEKSESRQPETDDESVTSAQAAAATATRHAPSQQVQNRESASVENATDDSTADHMKDPVGSSAQAMVRQSAAATDNVSDNGTQNNSKNPGQQGQQQSTPQQTASAEQNVATTAQQPVSDTNAAVTANVGKKITDTIGQVLPAATPTAAKAGADASASTTATTAVTTAAVDPSATVAAPAATQAAKATAEEILSTAAAAKSTISPVSKDSIDTLVQNLKFTSRIDSFGELFSPSATSNSETKTLLAKLAQNAKSLPQSSQSAILDKVKEVVDKASQARVGNSVVVRLNPPDLGEMTVKVSFRDDHMFVRVVSDNPDVEKFMRDKAPEMVQVLAAAGFKAANVHLSVGSRLNNEGEMFNGYFNAFQQPGTGNGAGNNFYKKGNGVTLAQNLQVGSNTDGAVRADKIAKPTLSADAGWVA